MALTGLSIICINVANSWRPLHSDFAPHHHIPKFRPKYFKIKAISKDSQKRVNSKYPLLWFIHLVPTELFLKEYAPNSGIGSGIGAAADGASPTKTDQFTNTISRSLYSIVYGSFERASKRPSNGILFIKFSYALVELEGMRNH